MRKRFSTYFHKLLLWNGLLILGLLPLLLFIITNYLTDIKLINLGLMGLQRQTILQKLSDYFPRHRLAASHAKEDEHQQDLQHLNLLIDQYLKQLANPAFPELETTTPLLQDTWTEAKENASNPKHEELMDHVRAAFKQIGELYHLFMDAKKGPFHLAFISLINLPHLQEMIYQASFNASHYLNDRTLHIEMADQRDHLAATLKFIEFRVQELQDQFYKAENHEKSLGEDFITPIASTYQDYLQAIQTLLSTIQKDILSTRDPVISIEDVVFLGSQATSLGSKLWSQTNAEIEDDLLSLKRHFTFYFWLVLGISLSFILSAIYLNWHVYKRMLQQIKNIHFAIENFTHGQTTSRVSMSHEDEMRPLGIAFNQMAQHLEALLYQFHQLVNGIKILAAGDLNFRLPTLHSHHEFNQVAQAFNHMVESFEIIISRLQQLGLIVSNSALQVSTAAQNQEKSIIEQETTTRQIAVAAHEISASAKEFAQTVQDISHTAEQASSLAFAGKESLSNMASIMQQLVESASSIASRLAILSEKAHNITDVITLITRVADQTNLISLNAAIEAEKAGEYGRSFAVVAKEIRHLSDQTTNATWDIEKNINEMMDAVSSSVMEVDDFSQSIRQEVNHIQNVITQLSHLIEQVQTFTSHFEVINQGMKGQSVGAEQINEAITQLSFVARESADSIHQFYQTIQQLNMAAQQLRQLTPHLKTSSSKIS